MEAPEVKKCSSAPCYRDFIPKNCREHCSNGCCKYEECSNAKWVRGEKGSKNTVCVVCHKDIEHFVKFARCTTHCISSYYFQSSKGSFGMGSLIYAHGYRQYRCHLSDPDHWGDGDPAWHRPTEKPRIHIKYCTLHCYNSAEGHETRRLDGQRRRNRRWEEKAGVPGWRNRARQESGYFTNYWQNRRRKMDDIVRYGQYVPEDELRRMEAERNGDGTTGDPIFDEIFGPEGQAPP